MVHETGSHCSLCSHSCSSYGHSCHHWGHHWDQWTAARIRKSSMTGSTFQSLSCVFGKPKFLALISQRKKNTSRIVCTRKYMYAERRWKNNEWELTEQLIMQEESSQHSASSSNGLSLFWWWSVSGAWGTESSVRCWVKSCFMSCSCSLLWLHQRMALSYVEIN